MNGIGPAFDRHRKVRLLRSATHNPLEQDNTRPPWELVPQGQLPPLMFQLRFHDGSKNSFAYSDLREVYCRDAGYLTLTVCGAANYRIVIEGRRLSGLADLFGAAMVRWVQEGDPRCDPRPESSPEILSITPELIPD